MAARSLLLKRNNLIPGLEAPWPLICGRYNSVYGEFALQVNTIHFELGDQECHEFMMGWLLFNGLASPPSDGMMIRLLSG